MLTQPDPDRMLPQAPASVRSAFAWVDDEITDADRD
jgi:hypothetical protein